MAEGVQKRTGGSLHITITRRKEGPSKTAEADLTAEPNSAQIK